LELTVKTDRPHGTGLRADARRNRDQIVAAALTLFLDQGIDVPLEEVARQAGVGIGTLYRRFPERDALIRAVSYEGLRRLADMAEAAWQEEADAWHALCRFLHGCAQMRLGALQSAIEPRLHEEIRTAPELRQIRQVVVDLLERITTGAQAEGVLRRDISAGDVGLLMTLQIYVPPHMTSEQSIRRIVDIMLNGLRTGTGQTSPQPPSQPATSAPAGRQDSGAATREAS
jgi:AcrR family transcriptional regulator